MNDLPEPRKKVSHLGAPGCFALEQAIRHVCKAFNVYDASEGYHAGCYLVGSAIQRPDWRDVDVRMIMDDDLFSRTFPKAGRHWEHDEKWLLLTVAISEWLQKRTGLPVDFQFQPQTHANEKHKGLRHALGLEIETP